ncbi:Aste57867_16924 [Aphanomyces stellatus]|uniref:Aste57867_16924 protein n=1 Tax=Aphanomyces stellatus TaxID=120398 RepID=A0A485L842_9STRA|nr:hypothetical protein As57867_016866 [Aphanomyces stellatus]VFT93686.1 Aste57867_16924 [Aphanomyces stellatus]
MLTRSRAALVAATFFFAMTVSVMAQVPVTPFPGTSPCQQCANNPAFCNVAYKGLPGQYCGPWLSGGVKQACCCPTGARCVIPIKADSCGCDSDPTVIKQSSKGIPFWVWILVAIGVIAIGICIWRCCCITVIEEPVYVPAGGVQYVSQGPVVVQQPYAVQQPYVVQQQYGYGGGGYGYSGGQVAAGVAVGAAAGVVGGVLIGEAIADAGHYHGGGYDGGYGGGDYGGGGGGGGDYGGGGGGGADFGGDF